MIQKFLNKIKSKKSTYKIHIKT